MYLFLFKVFHIVGFVAWFSGLFYLVRIFVYHVEAEDKPEVEREILTRQFNIMEWRVFKLIINPAMMFTFTFGIAMLVYDPGYMKMGWMHIKLTFLLLLLVYHFYCKKIIRQLEEKTCKLKSFQLRLLNEVSTLFLVTIVSLAVFKDSISVAYILGGVLVLAILLFFMAKAYQKKREA